MKEQVTEKLLSRYFEKTATYHEKILVKEWLQDPGNEEIFFSHLARWESDNLQFIPDENKALDRFKLFLEGGESERNMTVEREASTYAPLRRYAAIAASLVFLVSVCLYFAKDYFLYDTYQTAYGSTQRITLDDGSDVTLNANSVLKVSKNIGTTDLREVWLEGEAYFQISKKANQARFAVHTMNVDVQVLGTTFNVNNRRNKTEIVLAEGKVRVGSDDVSGQLDMKPGELVSLSNADTLFKRNVVNPELYTSWIANKLVFEDTPLKTVAEKLEDNFGVEVKIHNTRVAEKQLTGTFPNDNLDIVLKSLAVSHKLEVVKEKNKIVLK